MNLFSRIFSRFAESAPESREGSAEVSRTPAHLQSFLTHNWDGEPLGGGLSDPYNLSPWVSRAIKHIAGPIAQVELEFSAGDSELKDAELTSFWNAPAKGLGRMGRLSRFDVIEATVGWSCLNGEFFWLLDDTWLAAKRGPRSPFLIARPDKMEPVMDDGELVGWIFTDGNHKRHPMIPEQVITSRFWNPMDEIRGSAPLKAAMQAAESDYAAGKFWKSLAESNGDRGETVIAPNGISPEQEAQVIRALRAKRTASKRGKFQPMFFVGDIKTEEAKIQSPDAAAVQQRLQSRHEVFIAFGVPPSFAEVTASYSIGSASDRFKLIEETCQPMAAKIAEAAEAVTNRFLATGNVSVRFDFDNHSTMQQVRAERMEAGRKMHERGVPWQVINEHLNLKLTPFPGWDKAWLPFNLQAVADAPAAMPAAMPDEAEPVKVFEELEALLKTGCCEAHKAEPGSTPNARWEALMKSRAPHVKRVRTIVDRALFEARRETLANIAAAEKEERAIRSGAFDFIFDIGRFLGLLVEPVMKALSDGYEAAGNEVLSLELGSADPFIPADPNGLAWLRKRENFIQQAGNDIWVATRDTLDEGIQAGESYAKLAERVRAQFNEMSKERAMRIAVTETSIAMNSGRNDAMVQAGVKWKEWLTSEDDRVRLSHYSLNLKRVPIDEPFLVGGTAMMFPADPNGPPSEVINCRCMAVAVSGPEEDDIEGNDPTTPIPY